MVAHWLQHFPIHPLIHEITQDSQYVAELPLSWRSVPPSSPLCGWVGWKPSSGHNCTWICCIGLKVLAVILPAGEPGQAVLQGRLIRDTHVFVITLIIFS